MATVTIRPNADGAYVGYIPSAGSAWECVDESVANNLTDYIYGTYSDDNVFAHTSAGLTGTETINSVTIGFKAITSSAFPTGLIYSLFYINSSYYYSDSNTTIGNSWVIAEDTYTLNPDTGTAWTKSVIDSMQFGVSCSYTGDPDEIRVTQIYAIIDYTASGGGSSSFATKLLLSKTGK
jgi:hypothetical protein